jgi:hypothetical protein
MPRPLLPGAAERALISGKSAVDVAMERADGKAGLPAAPPDRRPACKSAMTLRFCKV